LHAMRLSRFPGAAMWRGALALALARDVGQCSRPQEAGPFLGCLVRQGGEQSVGVSVSGRARPRAGACAVRRPPGRLGGCPAHGLAPVHANGTLCGAQPRRGAHAPQRRGAGGRTRGARVLPARRRRRGRARARGRGGRAPRAARRGAGGGRRARSDNRGAACACGVGPYAHCFPAMLSLLCMAWGMGRGMRWPTVVHG